MVSNKGKRAKRVRVTEQLDQVAQLAHQESLLSVVSFLEEEVETHSHYGQCFPAREWIEKEYNG